MTMSLPSLSSIDDLPSTKMYSVSSSDSSSSSRGVFCFLFSFLSIIGCIVAGVVVTTQMNNDNAGSKTASKTATDSSFRFKFYNPQSYKILEDTSGITKTTTLTATTTTTKSASNHFGNDATHSKRHYYAHPNHSVWDELVLDTDVNKKIHSNSTNENEMNVSGVYQISDFQNDEGYIPAYWNCLADTTSMIHDSSSSSTNEINRSYNISFRNTNRDLHRCDVRHQSEHQNGGVVELGPCFAPHGQVNWREQMNIYHNLQNSNYSNDSNITIDYKSFFYDSYDKDDNDNDTEDWANHCRPGFIIIGAGKCGTSSLYHYLTDHPRVLPAKEKQIHYFKYFTDRSLTWYYRHFPTTTSFLSSGALLTGEASPGYLPYPDVANLLRNRITSTYKSTYTTNDSNIKNNNNKQQQQPDSLSYVGPKIITVGREPIDRAYSSYKYNYVTPTIEGMRRGRFRNVPPDRGNKQPDSFYEPYLFTFEELMEAELAVLKECLSLNSNNNNQNSTSNMGSAIIGARDRYGKQSWIQHEFERRDTNNLPPLAVVDEFCYETTTEAKRSRLSISGIIPPRKQWVELHERFPNKVMDSQNVHLKQSLLGRGLYALPLEWWYGIFPHDQLYFVCTEELSDAGSATLNDLGTFLGLPSRNPPYNFSTSVQKGAYNVDGSRGYDTEIPWSDVHKENVTAPLSNRLRMELEEFIRPYNERLFDLIGRRCAW